MILSSNLRFSSSRWSLYFRFARQNNVCPSLFIRATCPTQFTFLDRIILIIFSGESISRKYPSAAPSQSCSSLIYLFRQPSNSSLSRFKTYNNETNITYIMQMFLKFNPLNPKLDPICYLLALLGAHHFFHVSRIRVKLLTFRLLMYIYGAPILDVSRSHTTTQHSR